MKSYSKPLALLVILLTGTWCTNIALGAKKPARATVEGLVVSVDGTNLVLNSADDKHFTRVTLATDGKTEVTIDGKPGKLSDLKEAQCVTVTPAKGTPKLIEAKKPHGGKLVESGLMEGGLVEIRNAEIRMFSPLTNGDIVEIKVPLGGKTVVVIDGKESTVASLKAGQYVMVAVAGGSVRRIIVQPPTPAN